MAKNDLPMIADPVEQFIETLQGLGYSTEDFIVDGSVAVDFPTGTELEFMRHYFLGCGGPFTNFVNYVDMGVGFEFEPVFEDEEEGQDAKEEMEQFADKIDLLGTMLSYSAYSEILGRSCLVLTGNALGDDFFYDENANIRGIDCINPMTLDTNSIEAVIRDKTGTKPFKQIATDETETDVYLDQSRVIYRIRSPFTDRGAVRGISQYQNALGDLRTVVKYPRFREQISRKLANIFRIFTIDHEMLKDTPLGRQVLASPESERAYLLNMQNLLMQQEMKHTSIASFKWLTATENSYAGKEPDIAGVEKQSWDSLGINMEVPIHLMSFSKEVNRATLEELGAYFVKRRKNGPQKRYKAVLEQITSMCMEKWGYNGTLRVKFNPFIEESEDTRFNRVANLYPKAPELMTELEWRRELGKPDEKEYGEGELEAIAKKEEQDKQLAVIRAQQPQGPPQQFVEGQNAQDEKNNPQEADATLKEVRLAEAKSLLRSKGIIRRI